MTAPAADTTACLGELDEVQRLAEAITGVMAIARTSDLHDFTPLIYAAEGLGERIYGITSRLLEQATRSDAK